MVSRRLVSRTPLAAALAALLPGPLAAQVPQPAQTPQEPERVIPVDREADQRGAQVRRFTLEDALRVSRANNLGLREAELLPEQARLDLVFAEAAFEPELYSDVGYSDSESPARNAFQPSFGRTVVDASVGWRQRVVTGGMFDLAYRPARIETSSSGAFPDRQFTSDISATLRQPLLRGAWTDYNLAPINDARYAEAQARFDFERTVQDTLQRTVEAYWELVFSRENWNVVFEALVVAREQLRITEERIRVRELAPRDRVADEAEVARRQEELILADNAVRTREDDLRRLLLDGSDPTHWKINLRPSSDIAVTPHDGEIAEAPLIDVAIAQRPDLRALRAAVARAEVALVEAERDVLPALDIVGAWGSDGVRDSFTEAFRDSSELEYPDWSLRLEFALPIGNHAARARRQRAALEVERQRRALHGAVLDVTKEVREAVRNLHTLGQSVRASLESVRLAETNLETEQVKLRVGASTNFEVQRRNQALREARSRHLRYQLDYRVAESRLLYVQGILEPPR